MKVLVYGYAFPGSDRIRLNTVLLNPVSLLCLYLYHVIVTSCFCHSSSVFCLLLPPSQNSCPTSSLNRENSGIASKRHTIRNLLNEHYPSMHMM